MRPAVLKALNEQIARRAQESLPGFSPYARRERGEDRGTLRFCSELKPGLFGFVVFRPIPSEAFDAYVGWSVDGRCPYALIEEPVGLEDFEKPRAMFPSATLANRLGSAHWNFWNPPDSLTDDPAAFALAYMEHFGRELSEAEAQELVAPAVEAGFAEVIAVGIPYLARRAASDTRD